MPSRKKAKGKARKAAKEAKAKEEESRAVVEVATCQLQDGLVEAMMQRLVINPSSLELCRHGLAPSSADDQKIFQDFIDAFIANFRSQDNVGRAYRIAHQATKDKYANVYASKLDSVISILLVSGTQRILEGDNRLAQLYASLACCFEKYMTRQITLAIDNSTNLIELESADIHTLVQYYRKRIPCSCLDEKYKEVKSVKKMGSCFNPSCSLPGRKAERSKMFSCSQCGVVNYCSVECQRANWKAHRHSCCNIAKIRAAFDSE